MSVPGRGNSKFVALGWGCVGSNKETSASENQAGGEWEEQRPQREEALATSLAGHRRKIGLSSCPALRYV